MGEVEVVVWGVGWVRGRTQHKERGGSKKSKQNNLAVGVEVCRGIGWRVGLNRGCQGN